MDKNPDRKDLTDRRFELAIVIISLLTALIELVSKVVNYARPIRKF